MSIGSVVFVPLDFICFVKGSFNAIKAQVGKGQHNGYELECQKKELFPPLLPFIDKEEYFKWEYLQEKWNQEDQEVGWLNISHFSQLFSTLHSVHNGQRKDKNESEKGLAIKISLDLLPLFKDETLKKRMSEELVTFPRILLNVQQKIGQNTVIFLGQIKDVVVECNLLCSTESCHTVINGDVLVKQCLKKFPWVLNILEDHIQGSYSSHVLHRQLGSWSFQDYI